MSTPFDLISLVLELRPLPSPDSTTPLPLWWGRAAHALLLNTIRQYDPNLAESLHENASTDDPSTGFVIRPFTCSTLIGRFPHATLDPHATYTLRLSAFSPEITAILHQAAQDGPLSPGNAIELDYLPFLIEAAQFSCFAEPHLTPPTEHNAWANLTSYQELSAPLLTASQPAPRRLTLQFASPATFKSGGKHVPIPLPELTFGSLLERWNAFAPVSFPQETKRYAAECLAVSRYQLSTRAIPGKSGALRVGCVGQATYTSLNYDRYWMSLIAVLAAFSLFSGIGAGTSMGLGQTRLLPQTPELTPCEP